MPHGISVEYRDRVAIITLDNPKKLNALTKDGFYQISNFLREIEEHDEVFITVLTGKGRFFSAYVIRVNPFARNKTMNNI
jgi:Delta3-Delta2-enoyl-CoA isomerase